MAHIEWIQRFSVFSQAAALTSATPVMWRDLSLGNPGSSGDPHHQSLLVAQRTGAVLELVPWNAPTSLSWLIAFLVYLLDIHWLSTQLQAKCLWVSDHCMTLQSGLGLLGACKEWYCMMWCGEAWGAAGLAQKLLPSYPWLVGVAEHWKCCRSMAKAHKQELSGKVPGPLTLAPSTPWTASTSWQQ